MAFHLVTLSLTRGTHIQMDELYVEYREASYVQQ
jgi:hypothetical protein